LLNGCLDVFDFGRRFPWFICWRDSEAFLLIIPGYM